MASVISSKNKNILKGGHNPAPLCECPQDQCPVEGQCKLSEVIYQAKLLTQNNEEFSYIGLTEQTFHERHTKHLSSFTVHDRRNSTSLSKKMLELQTKHILFDIEWKILEKTSP